MIPPTLDPNKPAATVSLPRFRPGDHVFVRNGVSLLLGTIRSAKATPVPVTDTETTENGGIQIWTYEVDGWGTGYLEGQLTKVPERLRSIAWNPHGVNLALDEWPPVPNLTQPPAAR